MLIEKAIDQQTSKTSPGLLYVVATPIGNLEDITFRAARILGEVDVIAAEDTRRTRVLLRHLSIAPRQLISLHEHNEARQVAKLVRRITNGESIALVSDAGTPLISDPGYRLVRAAGAQSIEVVSVPGPCSVTAALSVSGLATDRFVFEGFLPQRASARCERLKQLVYEPRTLIFFESPRRIKDVIQDMEKICSGDRQAVICREMTKIFESVIRGTLNEISTILGEQKETIKGEIVLLLDGAEKFDCASSVDEDLLLTLLSESLPPRRASEIAARLTGKRKNDLYQKILLQNFK